MTRLFDVSKIFFFLKAGENTEEIWSYIFTKFLTTSPRLISEESTLTMQTKKSRGEHVKNYLMTAAIVADRA